MEKKKQAKVVPGVRNSNKRPKEGLPLTQSNYRSHVSAEHNKVSQPSRSVERGGKSGESGLRTCREHSFLTDVADVRQMEQGLLQLLDDFHSGKLQAFGQDCTYEKMDQVREQQERLARLHFELDSRQEMQGWESVEAREAANESMSKLMDNLHELCTSLQNLQKDHHPKNA